MNKTYVKNTFELREILSNYFQGNFPMNITLKDKDIVGIYKGKKIVIKFMKDCYLRIYINVLDNNLLSDFIDELNMIMGDEAICMYDLLTIEGNDNHKSVNIQTCMEWDIKNPLERLSRIENYILFSDNQMIFNYRKRTDLNKTKTL